MTEYREGDSQMTVDEEMVQVPVESMEEKASMLTPVPDEQVSEAKDRVAVTAALIIQFEDGRIDAITDLPSIEKNHTASIREVRNMCNSIVSDMDSLLTVKMFSQEMQMHAARAQMQKQLEHAQKNLNMTPQQMQAMVNNSMRAPKR